MGIVIEMVDGRFVPLVRCDECHQEVRDPGRAVVVFCMDEEPRRPPSFAHKGSCHDYLEARLNEDGVLVGWNEFGRWMADLLHNAGLHGEAWERAKEWSDVIQRLDL